MNHLLTSHLQAGLCSLHLDLSAHTQSQLLAYIDLLAKWNKVYNLTAVRTKEDMIDRHLIDSLSITAYIKGEHILDVGSGAGLPGIPLALFYPDKQFTLLDSQHKKTRFLTQVKHQLQLDNVTVVHQRVQDHNPTRKYDCITTRAFATLAKIISQTAHLCTPDCIYVAMKGQYPNEEISTLPPHIQASVYPLSLTNLQHGRHVVILEIKH